MTDDVYADLDRLKSISHPDPVPFARFEERDEGTIIVVTSGWSDGPRGSSATPAELFPDPNEDREGAIHTLALFKELARSRFVSPTEDLGDGIEVWAAVNPDDLQRDLDSLLTLHADLRDDVEARHEDLYPTA